MREFFKELRQRKVFSVAAAYVVVAWLLLQVAATVFPIFDAPPWVLKVITSLLVLGFPVAVVLAWAYELTPRGIIRTDASHGGAGSGEAKLPGPSTAGPAAHSSPELPSGPSIAVMPFRNLSGDSSQDPFAEALSSDIISGLTRSSHLFVLSAGATAGLAHGNPDLVEAGRSLGVSYLLSGTVQKSGGMLRVSAELADVANSIRIWSQKYDRELSAENLFAVQDDIREQIVATLSDLHGVIYSTQAKKNVHRPTSSLNAYELLSVALAYDKYLTPQHHLRARESLERAIEIDPNFDEAWSHLSWIYTDEYVFGFNPRPRSMERALAAARKAVELAPDNYHNHWLLSRVHYFLGDREQFLAESQRALELNSSDGTTLGLIGIYTSWTGQWDRGIDMLTKAKALNPGHPDYYHSAFGIGRFVAEDYSGALHELLKANLPEWLPHQVFLTATYVMLDRPEDGRRQLEQIRALLPDVTPDSARQLLDKVLPFQPELVSTLSRALANAGLGNRAGRE